MLASFFVTSTGDGADADPNDMACDDGSGSCTLRAAIEQANVDTTLDMIEFRLSGAGPHTIQPASPLPVITSPVILDGTTQPGFAGSPVIELDGTAAGMSPAGLHIMAGRSTVRGLVINRFAVDGLVITGDRGNVIEGNFIGTDITGTQSRGNGADGIFIVGSAENRIGTNGDGVNDNAERNVIAANGQGGVRIVAEGSDDNVVAGNLIGTDVTGTRGLGNGLEAIHISQGKRNRVGTNGDGVADQAERNILADSRRFSGIVLAGAGTEDNVISGNYIGTDITGNAAIGNGDTGVVIAAGARANRVGTNGDGVGDEAERNVVSGNFASGISINGVGTDANIVAGNFVGTDVAGTRALGNVVHGVVIFGGARHNRIGTDGNGIADAAERNIISSNRRFEGVAIANPGTEENIVAGNFIGTDLTGTMALGNGEHGVSIFDGARSNRIGTNSDGMDDEAERNVISGNLQAGVSIAGAGTEANVIAGNWIGTNLTGTIVLPNGGDGVIIFDQAANNTVGGIVAAARNVISGNKNGVRMSGTGVTGNRVLGNFIGTDITGAVLLRNEIAGVGLDSGAASNTVGGTVAGARNVVAGNQNGIRIVGAGTSNNLVQRNHIGTDITGTIDLGNASFGVHIDTDASLNFVGGDSLAARNLISGNTDGGVRLADGAFSNFVQGNFIGTDATGNIDLGNSVWGVLIDAGAFNNFIGTFDTAGGMAGQGNVISGNDRHGIEINGHNTTGNQIAGNLVGTNAAGTAAVGNSIDGVQIVDARSNTIGGFSPSTRNIISGNGSPIGGSGIAIFGTNATGNQILNNWIGTDATGMRPLANAFQGVALNSPFNFVGSIFPQIPNVISGNGQHGVALFGPDANRNAVIGNFIGTDPTGTLAVGNSASGIFIEQGSNNAIGGLAVRGLALEGERRKSEVRRRRDDVELLGGNIIAFNGRASTDAGVLIAGGTGNTVHASNSIFSNAGLGIDLAAAGVNQNDASDSDTGANNLLNFAVLSSAKQRRNRLVIRGRLNSAPHSTLIVGFFANTEADATGHGEGKASIGFVEVTTNNSGEAKFSRRFRVRAAADFVTSTATDADGNTSEFSAAVAVVNRRAAR